MEFKEFSNPEEENYDIKSSLSNYGEAKPRKDESNPLLDEFLEEDEVMLGNFIEEDIFEDDKIEETLRKYNYDYKLLLRELTSFISYGELQELLRECDIKMEEYLNPTYETFDIMRDRIINNKTRVK